MTPHRWFILGLFLRFVVLEALCLVLWFQVQALLPSIVALWERVR